MIIMVIIILAFFVESWYCRWWSNDYDQMMMFNLNLFSMFLNIWSRAVLLFTAFILDPMTTDPNVFHLHCFMPFDNDDNIISDDVRDYEILKFSRNEAGHGSPWAGQSFVANNFLHGWIRVTRHCHHCQWRCILPLLHLHDHRQVATGRQPKVSPARSWGKLSAFTSSFRWRIMMMMIIVMIMTIICRSQTYVQHLRRQVRSHFVFKTIL